MARPLVEISDDQLKRMETAAATGARWKDVAIVGDVPYESFKTYMKNGRKLVSDGAESALDSGPSVDPPPTHARVLQMQRDRDLYQRLTRARAIGAQKLLARLIKISDSGSERAAMFLLERIHGYNQQIVDDLGIDESSQQQDDSPQGRLARALGDVLTASKQDS